MKIFERFNKCPLCDLDFEKSIILYSAMLYSAMPFSTMPFSIEIKFKLVKDNLFISKCRSSNGDVQKNIPKFCILENDLLIPSNLFGVKSKILFSKQHRAYFNSCHVELFCKCGVVVISNTDKVNDMKIPNDFEVKKFHAQKLMVNYETNQARFLFSEKNCFLPMKPIEVWFDKNPPLKEKIEKYLMLQ